MCGSMESLRSAKPGTYFSNVEAAPEWAVIGEAPVARAYILKKFV